MFEKLHNEIEIFLERRVQLIQRRELNDLKVDLPQNWRRLFANPGTSIHDIVREIWKPVSNEASAVADLLAARVKELLIVADPLAQAPPWLCYVFDSKSEYFKGVSENAWLGGPPLQGGIKPRIQTTDAELLSGSAYERFLQIHNGFLLGGNGAIGLFPAGALEVFPAPGDHRPLLAFSGDGSGNLQCLDLKMSRSPQELMTVDWDHEAQDTGAASPFWDYIQKFILWNTG